jgi:ATP-binding cassette subfamily C protein CydD
MEGMNVHLRLLREARSSGFLLFLVVFFGFMAGGLIVWQSWLLSRAVNGVFIDHRTLEEVVPWLRIAIVVILVRVTFTIVNETLAGVLAVKVKTSLRAAMLEKINRMGPFFLKGEKTGELATTAMLGLDALDAYFSQFLPQVLLAALLPLTILAVVFPLDALTGVVFLITAPLIPLFMVLIGKLSQNHTQRQWTALIQLGTTFLDTLQGLRTLMMLGRTRDRAVELKQAGEQYRQVTLTILKITFLSAFTLELIATISTALVAVEIGLRLLYARMAFEQAFFILLIAPEFYLPLRNLSLRYHAGMAGVTAAKRIFTLFDLPEPTLSTVVTKPAEILFTAGSKIEFKDVSFSYPESMQPALDGINLTLEHGKHYALVGASGSGKTTLAALLMQFIQPSSGAIQINTDNINSWLPEVWRQQLAWIGQRPFIFDATLAENVTLGRVIPERATLGQLLQATGLERLVSTLPEGVDTRLLETGSRLSGGEAQRVALARAFLKDAPIVILDEPTAHLDVELEKELIRSTRKLMKGRTSLTISHRLSTVREADEILVMESGRIVERGNHDYLLSLEGVYFNHIMSARVGR